MQNTKPTARTDDAPKPAEPERLPAVMPWGPAYYREEDSTRVLVAAPSPSCGGPPWSWCASAVSRRRRLRIVASGRRHRRPPVGAGWFPCSRERRSLMPSTGRLVPVVMERTTALVPVLAVCGSCRE